MSGPVNMRPYLAQIESGVREIAAAYLSAVLVSPRVDAMRITPPPPRAGWGTGECFACPAPRREHDTWGSTTTGCQVPYWRLVPVRGGAA